MASLTGQTIASTYDALLKITDNGPITASLKQITDGLGNNTPLYLSATTVFVDGNFRAGGAFYDGNNSAGTAGQFLVSTGTGVDWQNISESNLISGTGTNGFISKFTAAGVIANSVIQESGNNIGIGISPTQKLHVNGNGLFTGSITASNVSGSTSGVNTGDETNASIKTKLGAATAINDGYLTAVDYELFTNKVPLARTITINGDTQDLSANRTFNVNVGVTSFNTRTGAVVLGSSDVTTALGYTPANSSRIMTINGVGYNLSADRTWNVGTVTSINTSAPLTGGPITSSGTIGITQATTSTNGFLSSTDWNTFNNKQNALGFTPENTANKGIANGYASLDGAGKVPSTQLPSYVDDVVEVLNFAALPATGETGKIYITLDNNFVYRWSGSVYVKISEPNAVWGSITGTLSNQTDLQNALNAKQDTLTNPVTGTGTTNTLPKFTGASTIGNSNITDTGSLITLASNTNISTGALGIAQSTLTGYVLRASKGITGATSSLGISVDGAVQSDVTSRGSYFHTSASTQNTAFTLGILDHYFASGGSGFGSATVTNQYGFRVDSTLTGATNNFGFFSNIASGTGRWNLYMSGTANNYLAGSLGIGATFLTAHNLRVDKNITGGSVAHGIYNGGTVQSDVTTQARYYTSAASTQATTFTCSDLRHYLATQGTFGAGSTVALQMGFIVDSTLIGATENFGFRGQIPAGANRWNIYMDGTANNYINGALGISATTLAGFHINIGRTLTGAVTSRGIHQSYSVASDVTNAAIINSTSISTQAAAFTLPQLTHYFASQVTIGAGSVVTNQNGFRVDNTLIGATNNYAFKGEIAAGTGRWNLFMDGTANNHLAGSLGIGTTALTGEWNLRVSKSLVGAGGNTFGIGQDGQIQSSATSNAFMYYSMPTTQATSFTLANLYHYAARQGSLGAGSALTNQYGFWVENSLIGATNNFAFYGNLAAGTGRWNLYMNGTANNYLAGNLGIGTTSPTSKLNVSGDNITVSAGFGLAWSGDQTRIITPEDNVSGALIQTPGIIRFNAGSSEKMRITSGGNVGIGTSSPFSNARLQVRPISDVNIAFQPSTVLGSGVKINAFNDAASANVNLEINGLNLALNTNETERMRITSGGNVGIGTSAPATRTHFVGGGTTTSAANAATTVTSRFDVANPAISLGIGYVAQDIPMIQSFNNSNGSSSNFTINPYGGSVGINTSTPAYNLHVNGSVAGTSAYVNLSDERYKKNIKPIENALDKILSLNGVTFNWDKSKTDMNLDDANHLGLIAQEVEKVLPQAVTTGNDENETKSVAYTDIVPVLIEAIKELKAELDILKAKLQ